MITKTETFEKIYHVHNAEKVKDSDWNNFIMVSTKNWNNYFAKINKPKGLDIDEYKNARFVEFDTKESMFEYWNKKESQPVVDLIDWSIEFGNPCILELNS